MKRRGVQGSGLDEEMRKEEVVKCGEVGVRCKEVGIRK